jgi:hypothetical protein
MRQRMQEFRSLPLELKQALREKYQWFNDLPEAQQQELRTRWQNLSPEQKQQFQQRIPNLPNGPHQGVQNSLNQHMQGNH